MCIARILCHSEKWTLCNGNFCSLQHPCFNRTCLLSSSIMGSSLSWNQLQWLMSTLSKTDNTGISTTQIKQYLSHSVPIATLSLPPSIYKHNHTMDPSKSKHSDTYIIHISKQKFTWETNILHLNYMLPSSEIHRIGSKVCFLNIQVQHP